MTTPAELSKRFTWVRLLQICVGAAVVIFAALTVRRTLRQAQSTAIEWHFNWLWITGSLLVTWVMYGCLITGWRVVVISWRQRLGWVAAARIWTVSSLAGLLPGGIWSIAGMAIMAERAGVSPATATGSAIVMQLLSMATGAIIGILLLGVRLVSGIHGGVILVSAFVPLVIGLSLALTSSRFMGFLSRMLRRPAPIPALKPIALVAGIGINTVAWCGYGTAFFWLARGTIPSLPITWPGATGAFALAYLVGFIVPVPGGVGVREATLIVLLGSQVGTVPVTALALVSRLATLTNQFGAAAPFLFIRSTPRDQN